MPNVETPIDPLLGTTVGPGSGYLLKTVIGEGGMGTAYVAERDGVNYVVKRVRQFGDLEDERREQALKREADFLMNLRHPFLPILCGWFRSHGTGWLVMEHIKGETLTDWVTAKSQSPKWNADPEFLREVTQWTLQMAQVLGYLHRLSPIGIIHGDIKPQNILRRPNGRLVLIDFGISRRNDGRIDLPKDRFGTEGFADPAYINTGLATPSFDMFSLGVALHEWLSAKGPDPDGKAIQALPPLPRRGERVWDGLVACSEKARQPEPELRFPDMQALESELLKLLVDPNDPSLDATAPCPECQKEVRVTAGFCPHCGEVMASDSQLALTVPVTFADKHQKNVSLVLDSATAGRSSSWPIFQIAQGLRELQKDPGFGELISLPYLPRVDKLPHQIKAAKRALGEMRGFCLLADEVGLGKTIEAGLILKELMLRGRAKRILIIATNEGMCRQWQQELLEKFEVFVPVFGHDVAHTLAWKCDRLLTQYRIVEDRVQYQALLGELERQTYDLVIFDEAHHLIAPHRNRGRGLQELAKVLGAKTRHLLMLSATPLHNNFRELHTLLTLLKPGSLGNYEQFAAEHVENENQPRKPAELRAKLESVMIRTTRREALQMKFPVRQALRCPIPIPARHRRVFEDFRSLYEFRLKKFVTSQSEGNQDFRSSLREVVESFHSSPAAFQRHCEDFVEEFRSVFDTSFDRDLPDELLRLKRQMDESLLDCKVEKVGELLHHFRGHGKFLIFTQYAETAEWLDLQLRRRGFDVVLYPTEDQDDGGQQILNSLDRFSDKTQSVQALICSQNASEGLNLQKHAHRLINYDLPWDPMKIEQRIGRLQRLGGEPTIYIYNIFLKNTVEEVILTILKKKLHLFELTVGRVEAIVGQLADDRSLENQFLDLFGRDSDSPEDKAKFYRELDHDLSVATNEASSAKNLLAFMGASAIAEEPTSDEPEPVESLSEFEQAIGIADSWDEEEEEVVLVCVHCRATVEPDSAFCSECGARVAPAESPQPNEWDDDSDDEPPIYFEEDVAAVLCEFCHSLIPEAGATNCPACGKPISRKFEAAEPQPQDDEPLDEPFDEQFRVFQDPDGLSCPKCGESLAADDRFCSNCQHEIHHR